MRHRYWTIFLISLVTMLLSSWSLAIQHIAHEWNGGVLFFCVTLLLLQKHGVPDKTLRIVLCILAGQLILELPLWIFDFIGSLGSFYFTMIGVVGTVAGAVYYKHRTPCVLIAITLAAIILNTLGPLLWLKFVESVWHTTFS